MGLPIPNYLTGMPVDWLNPVAFNRNLPFKMPAVDLTGVTDSTAALQNVLISATAGQVVYLPAGLYLISGTLEIPPGVTLCGASKDTTILTVANNANLQAVIASLGWLESVNTTSQNPVTIRDLQIFGNSTNQSGGAGHGIVLQNFWSTVADVRVGFVVGDGLRWDQFGLNGSTQISGTAVENRVRDSQFRICGGACIRTHDTNAGGSFTDGWVTNCIIQGPGANGIEIDDAAGWHISGCHLYGLPMSGIQVNRSFMTRIIGNYIETWGGSLTSGVYEAINMFAGFIADTGPGSVISGNSMFLGTPAGNVASFLDGIGVKASTGATSNLAITGNIVSCPAATSANYTGINLQCQAATAILNAVTTGNNVEGNWGTAVNVQPNGGTINHTAGV